MAKKSPFYTGNAGRERTKQEKKLAEARKAAAKNRLYRWWLGNGESGKLVFLDTPDRYLYEHNVRLEGKFGNFFTCTKDSGTECPPCDSGDRSKWTLIGTIIDRRKWVDKKTGEVRKNSRKLLAFTGLTNIEKIEKRIASEKDLKWTMWEFSRSSNDKSPSIGDDFIFKKRLTKEQMISLVPEEWIKQVCKEEGIKRGEAIKRYLSPADYDEVLAVRDLEELRQIFGTEPSVSTDIDDDDLDDDLETGADIDDDDDDPDEDNDSEDDDAEDDESEDDDPDDDGLDDDDEPEEKPKPKKPVKKEEPKKPKKPKKPVEDDDDLSDLDDDEPEEKPKKPVKKEEIKKPKKLKKPVEEAEDISELMD